MGSTEEPIFSGDAIETINLVRGLTEAHPNGMFRQPTESKTRSNDAKPLEASDLGLHAHHFHSQSPRRPPHT